jgi:hypothetical protein
MRYRLILKPGLNMVVRKREREMRSLKTYVFSVLEGMK